MQHVLTNWPPPRCVMRSLMLAQPECGVARVRVLVGFTRRPAAQFSRCHPVACRDRPFLVMPVCAQRPLYTQTFGMGVLMAEVQGTVLVSQAL